MKRHEGGEGTTPTRLENWRHEAEWHAGQFCSGQRHSDHHYFTVVWSMYATDVRSSKANYILLRCYLPSWSCIWFEHRLSDRFMHWHKHPIKTHSLHAPLVYVQDKATNGQSIRRQRHFVRRDWVCSNIDKKSLGCKKPVGRTLLPTTGWGKRQIPRRPAPSDRGQSIKRLCELLKNYWPVVRNLRRLVFFGLSQSFAPSPGFSESSGGRLLTWWESFPGTGREMSTPA